MLRISSLGESNWNLDEIDVNVSSKEDIEACHRIGKSKNFSKTTIVRFGNRKYKKNRYQYERFEKNL